MIFMTATKANIWNLYYRFQKTTRRLGGFFTGKVFYMFFKFYLHFLDYVIDERGGGE